MTMPQLDIVSYFPQFFWFCIFFTSFYLTLVTHYLPKLTRIFAVRQQSQTNAQPHQMNYKILQRPHKLFFHKVFNTPKISVQLIFKTHKTS